MNAQQIARALYGRKSGADYLVRCPAHDDRTPSLSIRDGDNGRLLFYCHAGCDQARVAAALERLGLYGLGDNCSGRQKRPHRKISEIIPPKRDDARRTSVAMSIWTAALPAAGTLIETYLDARGLDRPCTPALRFYPNLRHPAGEFWPAMIALVTIGVDEKPVAIHRTFLTRDGRGKAPVYRPKMMLGPCCAGAVRLAPLGPVLLIGEGIETSLAAMQATGLPAWAVLSTTGLKSLDLPSDARDVIVLADGDDPGESAACQAAQRWQKEGRRVRIARPPRGLDFNDLLLGHAPKLDGDRT